MDESGESGSEVTAVMGCGPVLPSAMLLAKVRAAGLYYRCSVQGRQAGTWCYGAAVVLDYTAENEMDSHVRRNRGDQVIECAEQNCVLTAS